MKVIYDEIRDFIKNPTPDFKDIGHDGAKLVCDKNNNVVYMLRHGFYREFYIVGNEVFTHDHIDRHKSFYNEGKDIKIYLINSDYTYEKFLPNFTHGLVDKMLEKYPTYDSIFSEVEKSKHDYILHKQNFISQIIYGLLACGYSVYDVFVVMERMTKHWFDLPEYLFCKTQDDYNKLYQNIVDNREPIAQYKTLISYLYCKENPLQDKEKLEHYKRIAKSMYNVMLKKEEFKSVKFTFKSDIILPFIMDFFNQEVVKKLQGERNIFNTVQATKEFLESRKTFSVSVKTNPKDYVLDFFVSNWLPTNKIINKYFIGYRYLLENLDCIESITYNRKELCDF